MTAMCPCWLQSNASPVLGAPQNLVRQEFLTAALQLSQSAAFFFFFVQPATEGSLCTRIYKPYRQLHY